ncbi:hypothetical protein FRC03_000116 [Tulasnella sp. 419]|nr:hypothetical protein FRC03_000116 [Tulasnella sp. 419]
MASVSPVAAPVSLSPLNPAFKASSPTSSTFPSSASTPRRADLPLRPSSFQASRPLRPFPSIKTAVSKPSVKIIQPPAGLQQFFVLDMTQEELARKF